MRYLLRFFVFCGINLIVYLAFVLNIRCQRTTTTTTIEQPNNKLQRNHTKWHSDASDKDNNFMGIIDNKFNLDYKPFFRANHLNFKPL